MATKKYPIGTKIRFIANEDMCYQAKKDDGKVGKVVGETPYGTVQIFLPDSVKGYNARCTWNTKWENIKPLALKNQQLLFAFMGE